MEKLMHRELKTADHITVPTMKVMARDVVYLAVHVFVELARHVISTFLEKRGEEVAGAN